MPFPVDAAGNRQDSSAYRYMDTLVRLFGSRRGGCLPKQPRVGVRVRWVRASDTQDIRCVRGPSLRMLRQKKLTRLARWPARCDSLFSSLQLLGSRTVSSSDLEKSQQRREFGGPGDSVAVTRFYRSVATEWVLQPQR